MTATTDTPRVTREPWGGGGERLFLKTPFKMKALVKSLPNRRWHAESKRWHVPATQEVAAEVRRKLRCPLLVDEATLELFAQVAEAEDARGLRSREDLPPIPNVGPSELNPEGGGWMHQRQAYYFAIQMESAMLGMGMGTGKSLVVVKIAEHREEDLLVIICPNKVRKVWPREFAKWGEREWIVENGKRIPRKRLGGYKLRPSTKERVEAAEAAIDRGAEKGQPVAIVVNYEASWQGAMRDFLLGLKITRLVFDESHKIKAPGGKWSKFAQELRKRATRALGLTGTLMPHSETDVYAQYRALDSGVFGSNFQKYKDRYFDQGGYEVDGRPTEILGFKDRAAEEAHAAAIARLAYICDDDVLDLPEALDLPPYTCELSADTRRAYDEMEADFVTWVGEGEEVTASNALTRLLRLSQITNGFLPIGDGIREPVGRDKQKLLADTLDDLAVDEPVVVYGRFHEDLDRIKVTCEEQGRRYKEISGRSEEGLVDDPNDPTSDGTMDPDCDVVGVQLQAGSEGIDLTRARYCIYYALDFSLGNFKQSRKRVHRPGQDRETFFIYLAAENTVDETIAAALRKREDVVGAAIKLAREKGSLGNGE